MRHLKHISIHATAAGALLLLSIHTPAHAAPNEHASGTGSSTMPVIVATDTIPLVFPQVPQATSVEIANGSDLSTSSAYASSSAPVITLTEPIPPGSVSGNIYALSDALPPQQTRQLLLLAIGLALLGYVSIDPRPLTAVYRSIRAMTAALRRKTSIPVPKRTVW